MNKRIRIIITGNVTNVGYRYWTKCNAVGLGLTGWVRNVNNGVVEAVFEGKKNNIEDMVSQCKNGPDGAFVREVKVRWKEATGEYHDFVIKR